MPNNMKESGAKAIIQITGSLLGLYLFIIYPREAPVHPWKSQSDLSMLFLPLGLKVLGELSSLIVSQLLIGAVENIWRPPQPFSSDLLSPVVRPGYPKPRITLDEGPVVLEDDEDPTVTGARLASLSKGV